jgi:hypothetical protein
MSELEYPKDYDQWAWEKGLKRKCQKHGIEYDPHIFNCCPKCHEEEQEREEKKRKLKEAFDRIIWPDK